MILDTCTASIDTRAEQKRVESPFPLMSHALFSYLEVLTYRKSTLNSPHVMDAKNNHCNAYIHSSQKRLELAN